jgi:two-component system sensor histidine kinase/response regulator
MDDYLTKPIQPRSLIEIIGRWADNEAMEKAEVIEPSEASEVFDKSGFLERLGGDESLYRKLLDMFLDDAPIQIEKMQQYLKDEDLAGVQLRAHSLKGVAMSIGGKAMQEVASEIEVAARDRERDRAWALIPKLQVEFERLKHSIGSAAIFLE